MKIEINIDIEAIVREEIRNFVRENLVINNVVGARNAASASAATVGTSDEVSVTVTPEVQAPSATKSKGPSGGGEWEYAAKIGKRRSKADIALHDKEVALDRLLTPEEKGIEAAHVEINEQTEVDAKAAEKERVRIDAMAQEGLDAATAEAEAEAAAAAAEGPADDDSAAEGDAEASVEVSDETETVIPEGEQIPKSEPLDTQSLFD
jgi:hypothetical protein